MKSAAHFLTAMSLSSRKDDAHLFENAHDRSDMMQLLYKEAFLDRSGAKGLMEMHETWFVRSNSAVVAEAWRSYVRTSCTASNVEFELVAHLPTDGAVERKYAQSWSRIVSNNSKWIGASCPPLIERHSHYGDVRVCESSSGGSNEVVTKREVSRHPIDFPNNGRPMHKAALHVSTEQPTPGYEETVAVPDTLRYKCVQDVVTDEWRMSLICESVSSSCATNKIPAMCDVERVLNTKEVEFGAGLVSLRNDQALAVRVLGAEVERVVWRVELEFKEPIACCDTVHRGTAVCMAVFSAVARGCDFCARPLAASFVSIAMLTNSALRERPPVRQTIVERAKIVTDALCGPAEQLSSCRRPRELMPETLPETVGMAVTPKDDGVECTLIVVPGGVAWVSAGEWHAVEAPTMSSPQPAVLSAELVADGGRFVINDAWVLPGDASDVGQWPDLMKRVRAYTAYVDDVLNGLLASVGMSVWAKPWFYSPADDVEDLASAIDLVLDTYPHMGLAADGLVFCSRHDGIRSRVMYKFKPVLTLDCLVGTDGVLHAAASGALVALSDVRVESVPLVRDPVVAEFEVRPGRVLAFKCLRPDKKKPNSEKAVLEMFVAEEAFREHRAGLDLMLRLRNGARRFRFKTNAAKRTVIESCRGFGCVLDMGIGSDVGKYAAIAPVRVVGLDLSAAKLAAAQQRCEAMAMRSNTFVFVRGDMNNPATQEKLLSLSQSNEPVVVVSNWTAGYMDADFVRRFVVNAIGERGRFVGVAHFVASNSSSSSASSSSDGPIVFLPNGELCTMDDLLRVPVGACWVCTAPSHVVAKRWPNEGCSNGGDLEFTFRKCAPYVVIGRCGRLQQWILLDATAPNFSNCEYAVCLDEFARSCADAGLVLQTRNVEGVVPDATMFRASRPQITVSPVVSAPGLRCPVPPFRHVRGGRTAEVSVEPVAVPMVGRTVWTLWVTRRRVHLLFHPDGRRFRVHGLPLDTPQCVLRVFFNEGVLAAFDVLSLHGDASVSEEPFASVRHPQLRATLGRHLEVVDIYKWFEPDLIPKTCVGRLYLAANRRACALPVLVLAAKRRGDLLYLHDWTCVREGRGGDVGAMLAPPPLSASEHEARKIHWLSDIDRQVRGGVVDSVRLVGRCPPELRAAVSRWARTCCCMHEPVFGDDDRSPVVSVRALMRPIVRAPPPLRALLTVVDEFMLPLIEGVSMPWMGKWDRVGGLVTDVGRDDAVVRSATPIDECVKRRRTLLRLDYSYHEELIDTSLPCSSF